MKTLMQCQQLARRMLTERSVREGRWRELSRWICPQRGVFRNAAQPRELHEDLLRFTQVASQACLTGASGLTSGMTPRNAAWFRTDFRNEGMRELPGARQWLDGLDHLIRNCLASGGFYQAVHTFNMDLIWAGCALLYAEELDAVDEGALRYECPQVGTWAVTRSMEGNVNRVLRVLSVPAGDLADRFGRDALCKGSGKSLDNNPLQPREVWHLTLLDGEGNFPVDSYWWEQGGQDFLHVGGYREFPYFFTCWHEGTTPYGTGPGDEALPDARQIDILERHKLEGLAKIINPPVAAPHHLKGHCNLAAGAVNYVSERTAIQPIIDLGSFAASLPHLREEIITVSRRLETSLLAAIFNSMPLSTRPPGMSATEFVERKRESLQQLGPVISAYEPHVLTPLLFRTLQTLNRNGSTEPPPQSLAQLPLELVLDFVSPMANALRQTTAETTRALFGEVAGMVQATQDQSLLDKIDLDQMIDEYATGLGAPGSVVRADADVAAIRQQRAQAQTQAQAMQQQAQGSEQMMQEANAMSAQASAAQAMRQATPEESAINLEEFG